MYRRCVLAVLVLISSGQAWGQSKADAWLPAASQIYLSWDGLDAHRASFNKLAVGKMLQSDTGRFLTALMSFTEEQLGQFAGELGPDAAVFFRETMKLCDVVGKNGFRFAISIDGLLPPNLEAMLVLPRAADQKKQDLVPLLDTIVERTGVEAGQAVIEGRTVKKLGIPLLEIGYWREGPDLVIALGSAGLKATVERIAGNGPNITQNALYKRVSNFEGFPVWSRGYIDLQGLVKQVCDIAPMADHVMTDLGLKTLKSMSFQSGFDGPAERSIIEIDVPGPRKGILRLANQKKITLADLPPLPVDATMLSASSLDLTQAYDVVLQSIEEVVNTVAPGEAQQVKNGIQLLEAILGIQLRGDLVAPLGDRVVFYSSPSEVPLGLGSVYLVQVKDTERMQKTLARLVALAGNAPGISVSVKANAYHGATIQTLSINQEGNVYAPSFTVYKNWLAFSYYPQPLQGFVLRMNGDLPGWKANKKLEQTLSQMPKEFTAITISDPRPTIKLVLSIAPIGLAALNSFLSQHAANAQFDVSLLPNSHEVTRHLFPNVSIVTDDGATIRIETRASLMLPF